MQQLQIRWTRKSYDSKFNKNDIVSVKLANKFRRKVVFMNLLQLFLVKRLFLKDFSFNFFLFLMDFLSIFFFKRYPFFPFAAAIRREKSAKTPKVGRPTKEQPSLSSTSNFDLTVSSSTLQDDDEHIDIVSSPNVCSKRSTSCSAA